MKSQTDSEYCHNVIQDVSRTFAIGIERVSDPLSDFICVSYLLCRIPDTIEDDPNIPLEKKKELLNKYNKIFNNPNRSKSDVKSFIQETEEFHKDIAYWDLVKNSDRVLRLFETFPDKIKGSVRPHITEMIEGMKDIIDRYNGTIRIKTMDEFSEYCYYVAGTVGNLLTEIFSYYHDLDENTVTKMSKNSKEFGEALQTVNIIKDIYADYHEENSIFIPQKLLQKHGTTQEKIFKDEKSVLEAIDELNEHATTKLKKAKQYIKFIPTKAKDAREFTIIPYMLAVSTLREVKDNKSKILKPGSIKISRNEVFAILEHVPNSIKSNKFFERLSETAKSKEITKETKINV